MGLSIYLSKKPRDIPDIAQFHHFWALLRWAEEHVIEEPMAQSSHVLLEKEHLEQLLDTLNRLTPDNCTALFPDDDCSPDDYQNPESDYWSEVLHLKEVISGLLESFDFKNYCVELTAWW